MPSAMLSAVDLSAVAFAKLHSRSRHVANGNETAVNEPGFHRSARGIAPRATWAAAPEVKDLLSDSRRWMPLLRVTADTPCRLLKPARAEVLSRSCRFTLEGDRDFLRT
jgi:hypothetical protein